MVKNVMTILIVAAVSFAFVLVAGCESGGGTGAGLGALAGAGIGQLAGGDTESTLIGAAVGGAASAPVAAGYHREDLVPISIMLALLGYGLGNYLGVATAWLCQLMV